MKLQTSLVAVKKVTCLVSRDHFAEAGIDSAAKAILQLEGIINPPIIVGTSSDAAFVVVSGHFEYYAAVRASEIDPLKGEFMTAILMDAANEGALKRQIEIFR